MAPIQQDGREVQPQFRIGRRCRDRTCESVDDRILHGIPFRPRHCPPRRGVTERFPQGFITAAAR
ncbi:hypothetical protein GCM10027058_06580 [Microbacterium neimengense]